MMSRDKGLGEQPHRFKSVKALIAQNSPELLDSFEERESLDSRIAMLLAPLSLKQAKALEAFLRALADLPDSTDGQRS